MASARIHCLECVTMAYAPSRQRWRAIIAEKVWRHDRESLTLVKEWGPTNERTTLRRDTSAVVSDPAAQYDGIDVGRIEAGLEA